MSSSGPATDGAIRTGPIRLIRAGATALALGAFLGTLDVAWGVWAWGKGSGLAAYLPAFVLVSLALAGAIALIAGGLALLRIARPGVAGLAATAAVTAAWLAAASEIRLHDWFSPVRVGAATAVGLGLALFCVGRGRAARDVENGLGRLAAAAPWSGVLLVILVLEWKRRGAGGALLIVAIGLALGAALVLGQLARRPRAQRGLLGAVPVGLALAAAAAAAFLGGDAAPDRPPGVAPLGGPPRVILIVVDTLRADALSCLDERAPKTPALDALAADSLVFEAARSPAPWTLPAMASIFTGTDVSVHQATTPESVLPRRIPTLAERLRSYGYRTAAIGENSVLQAAAGLARGFDEYDWYPVFRPEPPLGNWLLEKLGARPSRYHLDATALSDRALDWVERHAGEDFFLWLHYFDPHTPYEPPAAFLPDADPPPGMGRSFGGLRDVRLGHFAPDAAQRAWIRALYDSCVRYTDREIGRFLDGLRAAGLYDDALIVLTSDHGEEFWEHGGFEHGHSVFEEQLRVPLLLKLPGARLTGRVPTPVSTASLTPSILAFAVTEVDAAAYTVPEVASALPDRIAPHPIPSGGQLYYEPHAALLFGTSKLVRSLVTGDVRVYDLARDPGELAPLDDPTAAAGLLAIETELESAAEELRQRLDVAAERVELDEDRRAELRALGYVD